MTPILNRLEVHLARLRTDEALAQYAGKSKNPWEAIL